MLKLRDNQSVRLYCSVVSQPCAPSIRQNKLISFCKYLGVETPSPPSRIACTKEVAHSQVRPEIADQTAHKISVHEASA